MIVYNYSNTCVVYPVKHPNFNFMHNIPFFSQFVFDKFIVKGRLRQQPATPFICSVRSVSAATVGDRAQAFLRFPVKF
jgi:hypothetical protein